MTKKTELTPLERRIIERLVDGNITCHDLGITQEALAAVIQQIQDKYGLVINKTDIPIH